MTAASLHLDLDIFFRASSRYAPVLRTCQFLGEVRVKGQLASSVSTITGGHSYQDQILSVKMVKHIGFYVYHRSC